jgi:hypothetical protein
MTGSRNHIQKCDRCGRVQHIEYALSKEAWKRSRNSYEILCLDCLAQVAPAPVRLSEFRYLSFGGLIWIDDLPGTLEHAESVAHDTRALADRAAENVRKLKG